MATPKGRIVAYLLLGALVLAGKFGYDEFKIQRRIALMPEPLDRHVQYVEDVQPILEDNCYKCHGRQKRSGELSFNTREDLLAGSEFGQVVRPGNSRRSRLVQLIVGRPGAYMMPPDPPRLTPDEVAILMAWIDQGIEWDSPEQDAASAR